MSDKVLATSLDFSLESWKKFFTLIMEYVSKIKDKVRKWIALDTASYLIKQDITDNWLDILPDFKELIPQCIKAWVLSRKWLEKALWKYLKREFSRIVWYLKWFEWTIDENWILLNSDWKVAYNIPVKDRQILAFCFIRWLCLDFDAFEFASKFNSESILKNFIEKYNTNLMDYYIRNLLS